MNPTGISEQAREEQAREELITSTMPLVGHIVRETLARVPSYVSRDDLTSAGLIALVRAAHSFDTELSVPFTRYASSRIRGAMIDELRSIDWASRSVRRRARELDEIRHRMAAALGRVPTDGEVANALGITLEEVIANADDVTRAQVLSLDLADEDIDELVPRITSTPEHVALHRERLTYMIEAVAELPERLRIVVTDYYLNERPMSETAAELGVTESRVSQLHAEALSLMRDALNHALDPDRVAPQARPGGCVARRRDAYYAAVADRHAASVRPAHPDLNATA